MKKISIFFILFAFCGIAFSSEINDNLSKVGVIFEYTGIVKAYKNNDFKGFIVKDNNTEIYSGFAVKTRRKSEAKIDLVDKTKIILTEKSSVFFPKYNRVDADNGTVLFKVTKRDKLQGFVVKTRTATIGVKGTQFAVSVDNSSVKVFCKKGSVAVTSIKGEFKRYLKKQEDEYSEFLKKQFQDYNQYKKKLKEEFIKYVKEIEMKPNMAINISDSNEVKDINIPQNIDILFNELDKL